MDVLASAAVSAAGVPTSSESTSPRPIVTGTEVPDLTDPDSVVETIGTAFESLTGTFLERLPLVVLGIVVFLVGVWLARLATGAVSRVVAGRRTDESVTRLLRQVSRVVFFVLAALLGLSVAGIDVGSALAALGIAGLAVAFAVQSILENFIAGILILVRRPFRIGDQVRLDQYEGTVEDVNLRVTRLQDYDGESILVPNAAVLSAAIVNLTERGRRRSRVLVGVDYRDDHDDAREVLRSAVEQVEGVLASPAPMVLLLELGDSSVNFEVMYWTAPDIRTVVITRDRVLAGAKRGLEDAGMTIPWPIRTLVLEEAVRVSREEGAGAGGGASGV